MKIDLSNKVALVTGGAGNGLGRAVALALGQAGATVAVLDVADCSETVDILKQQNIKAMGIVADISNEVQVQASAQKIKEQFGPVQILVNNAAILDTVGFFADISSEKFSRDLTVNLAGTANVTRAVWKDICASGFGRVVFISSIAGLRGGSGQASYATTKAGVIGLAKTLALEGAKFSVTANAVAPGVMQTDKALQFIRADMLERMTKSIPMRRLGKPEDIANTVAFLCSSQAGYITGQVLEVDGGSGLFVF